MGYVQHNAIVITTWKEETLLAAVKQAEKLGLTILGPSEEHVNGYKTLLICPDGSKEGWDESNRGDERRKLFRKWLREQTYDDGSSALEWVEIAYGNDDENAVIVTTTWNDD